MIRDPETLNALLASVGRFVRERLVPAESIVAETDEIPSAIVDEMKRLGLFGLSIPEEHGGLGLTMEEEALVMIELTRTSLAFRSVIGSTVGIGSQGILIDGTKEQQAQYLPKMATGELIATFALTEPDAGSDAASLRTTAIRDGDHYVVNGTKRFFTNAPQAGVFTLNGGIRPYFDDGTVAIYHGDCRDVLPTLDVADLLLTDPPYGVACQSGRGAHEMLAGDDGSLTPASWLDLALRRIRRGRHAYIFGLRPTDVPTDSPLCGIVELVWEKGVMCLGDIESPWGPSHEMILFGVQEISKANRAKNYGATAARLRKGSVLHVQRPHSAQTLRHPTDKPVDLLRILIESSSKFGETVLDPIAGSGSTLEAARLEGRKAIGIEIEERYCETGSPLSGPAPD